jgi:4-amino-4-deoxy-L-arabinose transferase-like glycosyltransferase
MRAINNSLLQYCLLCLGLIFCLSGNHLFDQTMFMDGGIYTDVSLNMMSGDGGFWNPKYTEVWNPFYEHPPLAFKLQSFVLYMSGAPLWGDAIYGIICFVFTFVAIVKIFKTIAGVDNKVGMLPIFILLTCPLVWWSIGNNILENTMMVFTTWASYHLIRHYFNKSFYRPIIAGAFVALAFLTKGFTGLFPLSLPFVLMFASKKPKISPFFIDTLLMLAGVCLIIAPMLMNTDARWFIQKYVDHQVMGSINNVQTVNSRFDIILKYLLEIFPAIGLITIIAIYKRRKQQIIAWNRWILIFMLYSLTAVLPICISMKQRGFYILAAYPMVAIACAVWIKENYKWSINPKVLRYVTVVIFLAGLTNVILHFNKLGGHSKMITEIDALAKEVDGTVGCDQGTYTNWSIQAYFYRRHKISLDRTDPYAYESLIVIKSRSNDKIENYELHKVLNDHAVFKRKN